MTNINFNNLKDHIDELGLTTTEETTATTQKKQDSYPKEIASVFAYLIGVKKDIFENEYESPQMETYNKLIKNRHATIIRYLCMLRTEIERGYTHITKAIQREHKQLWGLADMGLISREAIDYLNECNINIDSKNVWYPVTYIVKINGFINQRISNCKELFPSYVNWEYIKELFIMPNGTKEDGGQDAVQIYYDNLSCYPYGSYINWVPREVGNLLQNDHRFVTTIYEMHGDEFKDLGRVTGLSALTKKSIESFMMESSKIEMIVDCENADPYMLAAALRNMDDKLVSRLNKLILVDDPNTAPIWKNFDRFVKGIPIKYINNERVLSQKSLVDIRLSAQVMYEYCKNDVDSFILVSSDSDFWGLIEGMLENDEDDVHARFLLFVEHDQTSNAWKQILRTNDIYYAYLDSFYTGNCEDIKKMAVYLEMKDYIAKNFSFNVNAMFDEALSSTYVNFTDSEKKHFYDKYVKTINTKIGTDGDLELVLKDL